MKRISKRLKNAIKNLPEDKKYSLEEAIAKLETFPKVKFDETVELHFHLGIDPKSSDQAVRGTVTLPHGTGKKIKVAVFCKGEMEAKAKAAGADFVGAEDLIDKVSNGFLDFDVVVAAPDMMKDLSKLGKVLGPRGLMPTPKAGTVTTDVEKAIADVKAGKIEFKADKQAGIHVGVGKVSFSKDQITENCQQIIDALNQHKPNAVKGVFIKSLALTTTMGPGVEDCFMNAEHAEKRVGQIYREKVGEDIRAGFDNHSNIFVVSYSHLSSLQLGDFRKELEKAGAKAYVAKNRIAQLTLKDLGHEKLADRIVNQTALVWSNEDSVSVSKIVVEFAKDLEHVHVQGGLLDSRVLEQADVIRLSDLPSKQTLQAMLLATIQAPLTRFAGVLNAKSIELLSILKQYGEKKGGN